MCLKWNTDDEKDHTCSCGTHDEELKVGKWFGIELSSSIKGCLKVGQSNYQISPFIPLVLWAGQRFYIDRFNSSVGEVILWDTDQNNEE